jgi:hypothetical protein
MGGVPVLSLMAGTNGYTALTLSGQKNGDKISLGLSATTSPLIHLVGARDIGLVAGSDVNLKIREHDGTTIFSVPAQKAGRASATTPGKQETGP